MNQKDREVLRQELGDYVIGTVTEWLRQMVVDVEDHPLEGISLRLSWSDVADGAMIANVQETQYGDPLARFGVQVSVEALPDLPPIGPENDLGIYGIGQEEWVHAGATDCLACKGKGCEQCHGVGQWREPDKPITLKPQSVVGRKPAFNPDYPDCAPEECGGSRLDPCSSILKTKGERHDGEPDVLKHAQEMAALESNVAPEWVPATFLMCLAGDRMRVSGQETDVLRSSSGVWHANNANAWHPEKWTHTELRMDLAANPGFIQYPPNTPCEILMSPERKAVHLLMQTFPGSQIVS